MCIGFEENIVTCFCAVKQTISSKWRLPDFVHLLKWYADNVDRDASSTNTTEASPSFHLCMAQIPFKYTLHRKEAIKEKNLFERFDSNPNPVTDTVWISCKM